jgi:hypothetical protein
MSDECKCGFDHWPMPCKKENPPNHRAKSSLAAMSGSPSGIELEVCNDIADRQAKGIAKYGTTVAQNPLELKAWLQHAYEETLDKAIYLKRAIREMENT